MVKIYCPKCGQDYDLDEIKEGQHVECQRCQHKFTLSEDAKKPPEPPKAAEWSKPGLASVCHVLAFLVFILLIILTICGFSVAGSGTTFFFYTLPSLLIASITLAFFGDVLCYLSKIEFKIGSHRE